MKRTSQTPSVPKPMAKGPSPVLRRLVKVGAWTLAVPALCTAVLVGGAAPLYLLLPEVEPSQTAAATGAGPVAASAKPVTSAPAKASAPAGQEVTETVEAIETPSTSIEPVVDEEGGELPIETVAVVPTPRPGMPRPYTPPSSAGRTAEMATAETKPLAAREAAQPASKPPQAIAAPIDGRRTVIRTAAKLRASPQGTEIGVLRGGAQIVVGRCDSWCEVSADGKRGYVHASLIEGTRQSTERTAERREEPRRPPPRFIERRDPDIRPDPYERPRYERREARRWVDEERQARRRDYERRFEERAYRRGVDPDWLEDDRYQRRDELGWYAEGGPDIVLEGPVYYADPYR